MTKPQMNLALKMAIHASGKWQKRIAKAARLSETRLSLIVNGHDAATEDEQKQLAKVLGKAPHELFPEAVTS